MREWINKLLSDNSEPSSKRFAGIIGWLLCMGLSAYAVITQKENTDAIETLAYVSAALLGLDTITGIFKNRKK